ncbi:PAS domain S-box protein, partial [Parvibaculum sp.]|uniref:PAS domain S-box protein n=1 Tax=Parvibaculum sp. TaxID=2024848 RepID=UPI0034A09F42
MDIDGNDDAYVRTWRGATLPPSLSNDAARSMFVRLFEAAGDVILIFDAHSRIEAANPALERILGYTPDEVRGLPLTMLLVDEQRSDIETVIASYAAQSEHVFVGKGAREVLARHKNGEERFFEIVVEEIGSGGIPMFLVIARDVTERRQRDESLRSSEAILR